MEISFTNYHISIFLSFSQIWILSTHYNFTKLIRRRKAARKSLAKRVKRKRRKRRARRRKRRVNLMDHENYNKVTRVPFMRIIKESIKFPNGKENCFFVPWLKADA